MGIQILKRIDNCKVLWYNRNDIWNPSYSTLRKEAQMGKSLNGKELGKMVRSYRGKCVVKQFETIIKA